MIPSSEAALPVKPYCYLYNNCDIMEKIIKRGGIELEFNVNSPVLFILGGIVIAGVLAQSVFSGKSVETRREIGMSADRLKQIALTTAILLLPRRRQSSAL